jgi:hypothetical protein
MATILQFRKWDGKPRKAAAQPEGRTATANNIGSHEMPPIEEVHSYIREYCHGCDDIVISDIVNKVYDFIIGWQYRAGA